MRSSARRFIASYYSSSRQAAFSGAQRFEADFSNVVSLALAAYLSSCILPIRWSSRRTVVASCLGSLNLGVESTFCSAWNVWDRNFLAKSQQSFRSVLESMWYHTAATGEIRNRLNIVCSALFSRWISGCCPLSYPKKTHSIEFIFREYFPALFKGNQQLHKPRG